MTRNNAKCREMAKDLPSPVSPCPIRDVTPFSRSEYGSAGRTRTYNQWINSPLLCQLSYRGMVLAGWDRIPIEVRYSESAMIHRSTGVVARSHHYGRWIGDR